jgi:hypothetical protein
MDEQYLTFKLFPDKGAAEDFSQILKQSAIDYYIEEDAVVFDPSYANNPLNKDYAIKIKRPDFRRANDAYDAYFRTQLDQVPPDFYLLEFTNDELLEILAKPDEWGSFDYQLAQDLLKKRGVEVSQQRMDALKVDRYKQLAQPEGEPVSNILWYYIVAIMFFPIGIVIGWVWGYSKKMLPDGHKVYAYNKNVRAHGKNIFLIAMILFIVITIWKMTGPR